MDRPRPGFYHVKVENGFSEMVGASRYGNGAGKRAWIAD